MSKFLKKMFQHNSPFEDAKAAVLPREPKLVVAHFMVGNTAPYNLADWEEDIKLASKHGIDGFALNVGREEWQFDQVSACFEAVEKTGIDFKSFVSFDMSSLASSTAEDVGFLRKYVSEFACRPHYLHHDGKALVSTFAGENALFGCTDIDSGWMQVKEALEKVCPICLVPSFFIEPRRFRSMRCLDGVFNWNGCWPIHLTPDSTAEEIRHPRLLSDVECLHSLHHSSGRRKVFMASVSPWFFTHYGEDSWNKNWIYHSDYWLLVRRWKQLIAMRHDIDIVQIISWNDYGESHYVGPIKGAQPNSEAWVNGFDHTAWLHLCGYFARLFKVENTTTVHAGTTMNTDEDRVYVWARPHPRNAEAQEDSVGRPKNWELTGDFFWVVILASAPAHVSLWTETSYEQHSNPTQLNSPSDPGPWVAKHTIPAGLSTLACPLVPGGGIFVQLVRQDEVIIDFHPSDFIFDPYPEAYNFNAYVAMYPPMTS